jgi:hypothetical protein
MYGVGHISSFILEYVYHVSSPVAPDLTIFLSIVHNNHYVEVLLFYLFCSTLRFKKKWNKIQKYF